MPRARTVGLLLLLFSFSMLGHAPATARASRCEKATAFAGEHRNPPHQKESWRLSRRARSVLAKIFAVRRQFDCEGQNHRRLSTSDSKLDHSKKGTVCQVKYKLLQISFRSCMFNGSSRFDSGSSMSTMPGAAARVRASARRWCCPPDSSPGFAL